jgi:class 3 adenylate cyclase/predicted ATPase
MDVADWLRSLGLSQYEPAFRESEIDADVLPELTDQHLEKLGVPLGHRLKMLRSIRELTTDATVKTQLAPLAEAKRQAEAERRQLTVMFCDLVGSTALAARLDPEDLREVIGAYHRRVAKVVGRYDGFVAKYMGDGVLIYFGYPQAHEDDAERAVRAGLKLASTMDKVLSRTEASLQVRVGIATGVVVVGDLIGSGEAQERGIVGETPNLAARLQGIAEPNTVVIAEGTRKLLGNLFELQDLGPQDLKGVSGPVRAWSPMRAGSAEGRFEAMHATGLTELVGREEEVELLLRRWSRAKTGEGQVVLLSGEAGIGKSRLTAALLERLASEPHTRLRYFCSPQHTDSAFFPIIAQLERAARLTHDDTVTARLDKLDALLTQSSTSPNDAALIAEMLSLPNDGRHPALDLAPDQRRQKGLEALVSQIEALARQNPVLMIFEDAHWSDPTSLEVFGKVVDRIRMLRVLLLVTFRPEFDAPWIGQPHVTALTLNRLTQRDVVAMIDRVGGNNPIPADIRQTIIERTDGVPLFVEEMTKAVLEAESEGEARWTAAAVPSLALAVPPTLHASLMARLDRLGAAKEVAQIGAAIGRGFSHALIAAVADKPEAELASALHRLISAGLLFRQGVAPHANYLFKHALVQDAAYGTLLREPRRALHARIAQTLESQFAEIAESQPELLAHHCTEAGLVEKASGLWGKAGQLSLTRSALTEAVAQFTRALDQIATLPVTAAPRRDQIKLQVGLANALMQVKGYAASETRSAFIQARDLMKQAEALREPPDDPLLLFSILYGFWVEHLLAFNGDLLRELAAEFLTLAEKQGATVPLMIGHRNMGIALGLTGKLAEAREHHDRALTLYDPAEHRPLATRFGTDTRVQAFCYRSLTLWLLGYPKAAQADIDHALEEAREIGNAASLMLALGVTSYTHILCGNYVAANALADELVILADEKGVMHRKADGTIKRGFVFALTGRAADAVQMITSGVAAWRSTGSTVWTPLHMSFLAYAHAGLGQFDDAWRCIGEAMTAEETTKERWSEADIHRTAGEIELMLPEPDPAKAQAHFERAIAIAHEQKAKSWELRAATSLARLWQVQDRRREAHDRIAPIYGWFTEGFDTRDLKEAKALLDELSSP